MPALKTRERLAAEQANARHNVTSRAANNRRSALLALTRASEQWNFEAEEQGLARFRELPANIRSALVVREAAVLILDRKSPAYRVAKALLTEALRVS